MILQSLAALYESLLAEGKVVEPGFQAKEIPFVVVLDRQGQFVSLMDTREENAAGRKTRGRVFIVPQEEKRAGPNAPANLLWDNAEYVFGMPRNKDYAFGVRADDKAGQLLLSKALARQLRFIQRIESLPPGVRSDEGVAAVLRFLRRGDHAALRTDPAWPEMVATGANVSFRLNDESQLVCERPSVRTALLELAAAVDEQEQPQQCLVTGRIGRIARLHPMIRGVRGAHPSGANIVSFNLPASESHGLRQGGNAPVSERAAFAYTTALNYLLAERPGERRRFLTADGTTYVFWAERQHRLEDDLPGATHEISRPEETAYSRHSRQLACGGPAC